MSNIGKFELGTKFVGNVNKALMEVVKIENQPLMTESGNIRYRSTTVVIKDLKTERTSEVGLQMLEHCNVTIVK